MAKCRHWSFKQIHILKRPHSDVKREACLRFGLTSRQFNGIRFDLDQAVNGWLKTLIYRIASTKEAICASIDKVSTLGRKYFNAIRERRRTNLRSAIAMKRRRLDILRGRLTSAEFELAEDLPKVCFGGRDTIRRGDIDEWRMRRNGRIFLVGSSDESNGNLSAHWNGKDLRIKMPPSLGGGQTILKDVVFRYGQDKVLEAARRNSGPIGQRIAMT